MVKWNILLLSILSIFINYSLVAFADSDCTYSIPDCDEGNTPFIAGQKLDKCEMDWVCGANVRPQISQPLRDLKGYIRFNGFASGIPATPEKGYLVEYWYEAALADKDFDPFEPYEFDGTDSKNNNAKYSSYGWIVPLPNIEEGANWVYSVLYCADHSKCGGNSQGVHRYRTIFYGIENNNFQCEESDSGRDYYSLGVTKGYSVGSNGIYGKGGIYFGYKDWCYSKTVLSEFSCGPAQEKGDDRTFATYEHFECPNGCKDGVCMELPILQPIPGRTLFVVYEKASVDDIKLMMRLRDHLKEQKFITNEEYSQKTYLGNEAFRPDLAGKVTTFIYKNNALIVVDDQADAEYIKLASSISSFLREIGANPLPTKTVSELGHPSLTQSIIQLLDGQNSGEKPEAQCLDSDGGLDSKAKGTVMAYGVEYIDHCARGGESSQWSGGAAKAGDVIEYACNGSGGEPLCGSSYCRYKVLPCPSEFSCVDGACARIQCMDSDNGKDPFVRGVTRGDLSSIGRKGEISESADFCVQSNNGDYPYAHDPDGGRYISRKSQVVSCENDCAVYELLCDPHNEGAVYGEVMPCDYGCSNGQCNSFSNTPELVEIEAPDEIESSANCPEKRCRIEETSQCLDNRKYLIQRCTVYIQKNNQCEENVYSNPVPSDEACHEPLSSCQGCQLDSEICLPVGTRLAKENVGFYCDIIKKVVRQKANNEKCQNSYECDSNVCKSNVCKPLCDGCLNSDNVCLPIGTRTEVEFCDVDSSFKSQKIENGQCNNNFECGSNLCVDNQCIEKGVFTKILGWFKGFFN